VENCTEGLGRCSVLPGRLRSAVLLELCWEDWRSRMCGCGQPAGHRAAQRYAIIERQQGFLEVGARPPETRNMTGHR
jgi:hypothetical protein